MMDRGGKKQPDPAVIAIAGLIIIVLIIAASLGINELPRHITWIDRSGFKHQAYSSGMPSDDEDSGSDHLVISVHKDDFKAMDSHAFIEKVRPVLDAYSDKRYITFMFGDGTGIYFPDADISLDASYGKVDKDGQIAEREGYITISGTKAVYEPVEPDMSAESLSALDILPKEYRNDDLSACIEDGILYLNVAKTANNPEEAIKTAEKIADIYRGCGFWGSRITGFYIALNYKYGYRVDVKTGAVTGDDSAVLTVAEKNGISGMDGEF